MPYFLNLKSSSSSLQEEWEIEQDVHHIIYWSHSKSNFNISFKTVVQPSKNEVTQLCRFAFMAISLYNICTFFHTCIQTIHPVPDPRQKKMLFEWNNAENEIMSSTYRYLHLGLMSRRLWILDVWPRCFFSVNGHEITIRITDAL